ncbi:MAG: transposase [Panacagrimonas sp.]
MQLAKASCEPGISVAKLAQSHGLNTNMLFKWRASIVLACCARRRP